MRGRPKGRPLGVFDYSSAVPRIAYSPVWSLLALLLATWIGGYFLNTVEARGRLVAAGTGAPITEASLVYGARSYTPDATGGFVIPNLPRGAAITVLAPGWTRRDFAWDTGTVELTVGVVNFNVFDATNDRLLGKPEARDPADPLRPMCSGLMCVGTETGSIAVPLPPPEVLVCAKGYEAQTVKVVQPVIDVKLRPQPSADCPRPAPSASPGASPSPTGR